MKTIAGKVTSLHVGTEGRLEKEPCGSLQAELDGFVGDRHRGASRICWEGDKQRQGTIRRNERQWSAVSEEELAEIAQGMDLKEPLTAASLGANICLSGVPNLSQLPHGTVLVFSSGAILMVEEYNPPCAEMGQKLAAMHSTNSGDTLKHSAFTKAAKACRGLVGVVEVAGAINAGDEVVVTPFEPPLWMANLPK